MENGDISTVADSSRFVFDCPRIREELTDVTILRGGCLVPGCSDFQSFHLQHDDARGLLSCSCASRHTHNLLNARPGVVHT